MITVTASIQVRRGLMSDFDPTKLKPGEWAACIDAVTSKQVVYMCFAAGVVKRMGTYEDFKEQIAEATEDIRQEYINQFNVILDEVSKEAAQVTADRVVIVSIKDEIVNQYVPEILKRMEAAAVSAESAAGSALESEIQAEHASDSALLSESYAKGGTTIRSGEEADNSKYYSEQSAASSSTAGEYARQAETAGNEAVDKIKEALEMNAPEFIMDIASGHLMYQGGRFNFNVDNSGHLKWEVAV